MNPPNPFGSPQGGAFQAPSNNMKTGLFQSFGQQSSSNQPQTMGFFPSASAFGQPSVLNQPSAFGQLSSQPSTFGQSPAFGQLSAQPSTFGQSSAQPSAFGQLPVQPSAFGQSSAQSSAFGQASAQPSLNPAISQAPTFGQPSIGMGNSGFGSSTAPAFGQTSGSNQGSVFGQTSSFVQPSAFGQISGFAQQAPGFGKQTPGFGQQASGFGNSQMSSGSSAALGQPQPMGFSQSVFGQPTASTTTTSVFGTTQSVTQSRGFGTSEFSFKPALFKPIFSASPEPTNPQTTSMSSSPFGSLESQTSTSTVSTSSITTTTSFPLSTGAQSGQLGFSFSQPAAAPSISAQNNPLTSGSSSTPSNTLQFTFSQPAAPSSSSTKASTTEPITPSSFSFSTKTLQSQTTSLLGASNFGQPAAFGENKVKAETSTEEKGSSLGGLGETNVFARLGKCSKRKENQVVPGSGSEKPSSEVDAPADADSPRNPSKRPLMWSRDPPKGLFGRALRGLRKDGSNPVRREATKEAQQHAVTREQTEAVDVHAQEIQPVTSPTAQAQNRDVPERTAESDSAKTLHLKPKTTTTTPAPVRREARSESSDSLSGVPLTDCNAIYCRNVPVALNKKPIMGKHFEQFGKVCKIICRPEKNMAIIHFDDHASAARAKKRGKVLQGKELMIVWQRRKPSHSKKGSALSTEKEEAEGDGQEAPAASPQIRRPALRPATAMAPSQSSPVMKLQFDTEPQRESSIEALSSERPVPSSLLHLIGTVAETAEDKYRLLEQRDKILRQGRPKRTDLVLSKVFVGTCPDMCPEKERYMRETRKQLSVFEVIQDTEMVAHAAAIKEYSRSSADQEEPLPHELRPLSVLSMTMDYMVTQIMDLGRDNYRDWYDFVWNRTRGIRKDIIQQHLCCPHTVSLIEKCTRFHVHCAHHLCEEHLSSFDAKINNENMTKCLQSLKEMYQDLATRSIFCPLEAEFRQYHVLLKLNDGDILREVQQFRDEVRNSPEVKFAVQAFAALNSNNFVRFFKLVKGASYLASCLLHRYFNQVRAKALKTLNIAYTIGPRLTVFPVEDVVRMLMFHSAEEATDFMRHYGLNDNDGMVELSRLGYQEPDLPLSQKKSEVILGKKTMLVGMVVNGGPLPCPPQHIPVCSFDSQNKYCGQGPLAEGTQLKAIAASVEAQTPPRVESLSQVNVPDVAPGFGVPPAVVEETGESSTPPYQQLFKPISLPQPIKPPSPPPKPQPIYNNEDIMAVLDQVIDEVVEAAAMEVATAGASYATAALVESTVQIEALVSEVLGQMLQEVSSTEIKLEQERVAEEKRMLEEARRRQEHEAFLVNFSTSLCTDLIYEVLDETVKEVASSEIQHAVNEKADRVAKCTEQVCANLVEETLNADIALLVEDILQAELQRIHKYIKRWRDVVAVRRQLKRQMRGFPAAPCCVDPRFKLKALAPSAQPSVLDLTRNVVNLGNAGILSLSSTRCLKMRQEVIHQLRVHCFYQQLLNETALAPLDLPALVTEIIPHTPERIFWKAVLLLPSNHESVTSLADKILSDWLEVKLGGGKGSEVREEQPDGTLQTLCVTNTLQDKGQSTHKVHISVKASRGPLTEDGLSKMEESCELHGTGALIMLLPALPVMEQGLDEQDVPLLSALLQLKQLQQASTWHCPLPLVILVPGGAGETQKLEEALMLHTLVEEGLISEYIFFFIPETTCDLQGSKQVSHAVRWLLSRAPPPFPLSCHTLVQLVEASLSREFSPRVYSQQQERISASLSTQHPSPVIQLYNAVLAHVADKVSSHELSRLSWPPGEFSLPDTREFVPPPGWNSVQHLTWLRRAILSLQLPQWGQLSATDSWSELCSSVYRYAAKIPVSHLSQPLLMSRLENLLERVRLKAQYTQTPGSKATRGQHVCPAFSEIPWDDILVFCIDHKLKDWQIPGPPVCEDSLTEDGEILVYFPSESLSGFQPPEEWTQAVEQTYREKQQEKEGASASACVTPTSLYPRQRLFHSLLEPQEAQTAPLDITHAPTTQELLAHKLRQSLEEEKAESKRTLDQFQRWLDGEPVNHLSTPLFIPSSALLSMPTIIAYGPTAKTLTQEPELDDLSDNAGWLKTTPVSMALKLKELHRQIAASQEEEMACRLKLTGLLGIVDD